MEPEWTKTFKSKSVCDFFFVIFVLNAIGCAYAVLVGIPTMLMMPMGGSSLFKWMNLILILGAIAITFFNALFTYLLCDRALLQDKVGGK